MKVFTNCTVVLQFDSLTSFKDKLSWRRKITENGGVVSYILTKKASFLVVFNTKNASCSFKIRQSHRHNIPVVGPKYVDQCLNRKRLLDIASYKLTDENNNERFTKGKILGSQSTVIKQKKRKRVPVKLGTHPSFIFGDVDAPEFNEETFELPKWALLIDKEQKTIQVLELHISPGDHKENKIRLFAQSGTVQDKKVITVEDGICWYFDSVDVGLSGYEQLYRRYTTSPVNMGVCEPGTVEMGGLGSHRFKMVVGKLSLLNEKISPQVAALTDHIWNAALHEVDSVLQVEMQFIREKQVEEGRLALAKISDKLVNKEEGLTRLCEEFYEAIPYKYEHRKMDWTLKDVVEEGRLALAKISDKLVSKEEELTQLYEKFYEVEEGRLALAKISDKLVNKEEGLTKLYEEFYEAIPYKYEHRKTDWTLKDVVTNQDLCQLLADINSVSEATDWSSSATVIAKYQALGCHLSVVNQSDEEYRNISVKIQTSLGEGGLVHNIYKIRRTIEEVRFQSKVGEIRQLMHASQYSNYLGILSRSLILPNIVTDKMGVARTDAGLLGAGIYFAESARKSAIYSTPNPATGTRMMLLCDVALGQSYEVIEPNLDLRAPPDGFDSVHGVKLTEDKKSFFKEDEYAIYNPNQQCVRYLVEFSLPSDEVKYQPGVDGTDLMLDLSPGIQIDTQTDAQTDTQTHNVDIKDVKNVPDPLAKIKAGLQGNKNEPVPLKAVHVRAQLMDMISQVVVLQAYRNDSKKAIEAKYVFPLDSHAAVCGFEAFINGKHINGEVKEKAKARKEYREAVSKGHGAYLMEEETPDVFSVSVGNLPPNSDVLIKITYVAELQVDGEAICFSLPATVAPWLRDGTLAQKTQSTTSSVKVMSNKRSVFSLQCSLEMPCDIRKISSPTHKINCKKTATKAVISLPKKSSLNDGFQLNVYLAEIHVPRMWVEKHPDNHTQACMLTFYPEFETSTETDPEIIVMLDMSNSMKAGSEEAAKKVALLLLDNLPSGCLFNIVIFGSTFRELFPSTQRYSKVSADIAKKHIQACSANMGSTDIWSPLHASEILSQTNTYMSNLFVISDGHVTQESEVVMATKMAAQTNRVFTMGVGSTVNHHLLRNLASTGGGTYEQYNENTKSMWQRKLCSQVEKACQPGLSDVRVDWLQTNDNAQPPVQAPNQIPCLFSGSRQVVYGFVESSTQASLKAKIGGYDMSTMVSTTDLHVTTGEILHRLTARAVIADYENGVLDSDRIQHQLQKSERKQYIIDLSKQYSIVTQYTSFVAVEERSKDDSINLEGPSIDDLVTKESVDLLPYIGYDNGEMDDDKDPELCVSELLQKGEVAESFSMVQAEETYTELDSYIDTIVKQPELVKKVYNTLTRFYTQTQAQSIGDIISQIEPAFTSAISPELTETHPIDVEMIALMPPEISVDLDLDHMDGIMVDLENLPDLPSDDDDLLGDVELAPSKPDENKTSEKNVDHEHMEITMTELDNLPVYGGPFADHWKKAPSKPDKQRFAKKKKRKLKEKSKLEERESAVKSVDLMPEERPSLSNFMPTPASSSMLDNFDPNNAYYDPKTRSMADRSKDTANGINYATLSASKASVMLGEQTLQQPQLTGVYHSAKDRACQLGDLKVLNGTVNDGGSRATLSLDRLLASEIEETQKDKVCDEFFSVFENEDQLLDYDEEELVTDNIDALPMACFASAKVKDRSSMEGWNTTNRSMPSGFTATSPAYSPTSPSYSPTSPAYCPTSAMSKAAGLSSINLLEPTSMSHTTSSSSRNTTATFHPSNPTYYSASPAPAYNSSTSLMAMGQMQQQHQLQQQQQQPQQYQQLQQMLVLQKQGLRSADDSAASGHQQIAPTFEASVDQPRPPGPMTGDQPTSPMFGSSLYTPAQPGSGASTAYTVSVNRVTSVANQSTEQEYRRASPVIASDRCLTDITRDTGGKCTGRGGTNTGRGRGRGRGRGSAQPYSRGKQIASKSAQPRSRGKQIAIKAAHKSAPAGFIDDEVLYTDEEDSDIRSRSVSRGRRSRSGSHGRGSAQPYSKGKQIASKPAQSQSRGKQLATKAARKSTPFIDDEVVCTDEEDNSSRSSSRGGRSRSGSFSRGRRSRSISRERKRKEFREKNGSRSLSRDRHRNRRSVSRGRGRRDENISQELQRISRILSEDEVGYRKLISSRSSRQRYGNRLTDRSASRDRYTRYSGDKRRSRSPYRSKSRKMSSHRSRSHERYRSRSRQRYRTRSRSLHRRRNYSRSLSRHRSESRSRSYRHRRQSRSISSSDSERSDHRNREGMRSNYRSSGSSGSSDRSISRSHSKSRSNREQDDSEQRSKRSRKDISSESSHDKSGSKSEQEEGEESSGVDRWDDQGLIEESHSLKVKVPAEKTKLVRNPETGRWERQKITGEQTDMESANVWRQIIWDKEIDVEMAYHEVAMLLETDRQYYELTEELCSGLGINYTDIVRVLEEQGVKSLGKTTMQTVYRITASLLALIFMIKVQYREKYSKSLSNITPETFTYTSQRDESKEILTVFLGEESVVLPYKLYKVFDWLEEQGKVLPPLYKVLELGNTKMEFILNLCDIFQNL